MNATLLPGRRHYMAMGCLQLWLLFFLAAIPAGSAFVSTKPPIGVVWSAEDLSGKVYAVAWSPDGSLLAVGGYRWLAVYRVEEGLLWEYKGFSGGVEALAWSPDGSALAVGTWTSSIVMVFAANGTLLWSTGRLGSGVKDIAWSPDSSKLAVGGYLNFLRIFGANGTLLLEERMNGIVRSVDWSSGGEVLAVGMVVEVREPGRRIYRGGVLVLDPGGRVLWTSEDLGGAAVVAWSPDGARLAVGTMQGSLHVFSSGGVEEWFVGDLGGRVLSLDWDPLEYGLAVLAGDAEPMLTVFDRYGSPIWNATGLQAPVLSVEWSPEGSRLAVDGRVLLVYTRDGRLIWRASGGVAAWRPGTGLQLALGAKVLAGFGEDFGTVDLVSGCSICYYEVRIEEAGEAGFRLNKSLRLYLSPGRYNLVYRYVMDPLSVRVELSETPWVGVLKGEEKRIELYVPLYGHNTIRLPGPHNPLGLAGRLAIQAPSGTLVSVSWKGGSSVFEVPGQLEILAAPGNYTISATCPGGGGSELEADVSPGESVSVTLCEGWFSALTRWVPESVLGVIIGLAMVLFLTSAVSRLKSGRRS